MKTSRYTDAQLRSLGYNPDTRKYITNLASSDNYVKNRSALLGRFKNVIDVLFDSSDGALDSNPASLIGENAPESVKTFAKNVLLCDVQAFRAAPDDETAFNMLIPRTAQTSAELRPYLDGIRNYISERRQSVDHPETT